MVLELFLLRLWPTDVLDFGKYSIDSLCSVIGTIGLKQRLNLF